MEVLAGTYLVLKLSDELLCSLACIAVVIGVGMVAWPVASQFVPNAYSVLAPKLEVNLSTISPGHSITINWLGTPVFVRNRLALEVKTARRGRVCELKDKLARNSNFDPSCLAFDRNRCVDRRSENWLVVLAPCTHLGCIPDATSYGWYCACHGSRYDLSGRVAKGPAPENLKVPKCVYKTGFLVIGR